jgi:hypothetical protein
MTDKPYSPAARGNWAALLDRIDASIARALDGVAAHVEASPEGSTSKPPPALVDDGFAGLSSRLATATRLAEAVDSLLAADEQEARAWVGLAERAGARLASLPGPRLS